MEYYKLKSWIDKRKFKKGDLKYFCKNPNAINFIKPYLKQNMLDKKCFMFLCLNHNAIDLIKENLDKLDADCWFVLCSNPNAIPLIKANLNKLSEYCWAELFANPAAVDLIKENINVFNKSIHWELIFKNPAAVDLIKKNLYRLNSSGLRFLCMNTNPDMMSIIKDNFKNLDEGCRRNLYKNPSAIYIIKDNFDHKYMFELCSNPNPIAIKIIKIYKLTFGKFYQILCLNPSAIDLIKDNLSYLDVKCWFNLCLNSAAIEIIEHNLDKISFINLYQNPGIFTYNYDIIKQTREQLNKEIIIKHSHPDNIKLWDDVEL
jgi:hypothetical protein